ncbi:RnfABCDGE type electron transport complex subunit B [Legionella dresdenensis]|uniref:RnfABCDGE type electron transport complex subunit B n=1 Tax=Legionella dresdenensis TaxID=450200 RepID=A0ABV8CDQ9_9GAMM
MTIPAKEIDALLPQTQCGECGFRGCMPYAEALVQGSAAINQCPPGGAATVKALAARLDIDPAPYFEQAIANTRQPALAVIREAECVGCTKCIQACPVDAIIGSAKLMHAIITTECTGCGLCVEPCPVDCIEMHPVVESTYDKEQARAHHQARQIRHLREQHEQQQAYREKRKLVNKDTQDIQAKQDYIQQAMARLKAKKNNE